MAKYRKEEGMGGGERKYWGGVVASCQR